MAAGIVARISIARPMRAGQGFGFKAPPRDQPGGKLMGDSMFRLTGRHEIRNLRLVNELSVIEFSVIELIALGGVG